MENTVKGCDAKLALRGQPEESSEMLREKLEYAKGFLLLLKDTAVSSPLINDALDGLDVVINDL